jgi:hypothetical protein
VSKPRMRVAEGVEHRALRGTRPSGHGSTDTSVALAKILKRECAGGRTPG